MRLLRLLYPGLRIKRWLLLLMVGVVLVGLAFAFILTRVLFPPPWPGPMASWEVPRTNLFIIGAGLGLLGVAALLVALLKLYQTLLPPSASGEEKLLERLYSRSLQRGPRVVAIGGGTGLATLLTGLKEHTSNLTAIVTVADDGGSSGRLRRELGVLPPGDFRNCLVALSRDESLMTRLFQYRFDQGLGLEGHSFGNLFIVALSGVTGGFEQAIHESSKVLAVRGQILASTLESVTLFARLESGAVVYGESSIPNSNGKIKEVFIEPQEAQAYPPAIQALKEADLIVLGPGSLYTSILPNLLVKGIQEALLSSPAPKVYVCNVATQPGETDGYTVERHMEALLRHGQPGLFDYVLVNNDLAPLPEEWHAEAVRVAGGGLGGAKIVEADLVKKDYRLRHEPKKLAAALMNLYYNGVRRKS